MGNEQEVVCDEGAARLRLTPEFPCDGGVIGVDVSGIDHSEEAVGQRRVLQVLIVIVRVNSVRISSGRVKWYSMAIRPSPSVAAVVAQ